MSNPKISITTSLIIWIVIGVIVLSGPLIAIWALNTLFPVNPIEITIDTYVATFVLMTFFGGLQMGGKK